MAVFEEQEYKKPFQLKIWGKMLPFFRPYKKHFAITIGLNILLAAVDVLVPLFQSYAIDHFITPDTLDGIGRFLLAYVGVIVTQTICVYISVRAATIIEMNVGKDLKWAQFEHLQRLYPSHCRNDRVGISRYVLGIHLCSQRVCDHVFPKCPACTDPVIDRSMYCDSYRIFSK